MKELIEKLQSEVTQQESLSLMVRYHKEACGWNDNKNQIMGVCISRKEAKQIIEALQQSEWRRVEDGLPNPDTEIKLYRKDAGVFLGYYGSLEEALSEQHKEQLLKEGLPEEAIFENQFYYYGMDGFGLLEEDTLPTHWMPLPTPPKE